MKPAYALTAFFFLPSLAEAQQNKPQPVALTIYNQDFAVARSTLDLNLHAGLNEVTTTEVTSQLEPDSVVLRDPAGHHTLRISEQNYDAAVVNQAWMLQKYEGRTIDFQIAPGQVVEGKIIRAGGVQNQPLIEVKGQMQFQMPGTPLFPASTDGLMLKPTLRWQIRADKPERWTAELAYITGGFNWEATYNIVAPETADTTADDKADLLGWVTIHNQSGTDFAQATIKLMAGDVAKIAPEGRAYGRAFAAQAAVMGAIGDESKVTQKAFDDFHLYDLHRTVELRNGESKQVPFIDAAGVMLRRSYQFDGSPAGIQPQYGGGFTASRGFGVDSGNTKVVVVQEIRNSVQNHLGMPLPAGRIRLYRRDADGQMEFIGESTIPHTPAEDTLKLTSGNAFDVKGKRRQTDFHVDQNNHTLDETFEVRVTNQKEQAVNVTVLEHMYRGTNWEIRQKSVDYSKRDSRTLEFPVAVPAKGEATLTYTVHYTW